MREVERRAREQQQRIVGEEDAVADGSQPARGRGLEGPPQRGRRECEPEHGARERERQQRHQQRVAPHAVAHIARVGPAGRDQRDQRGDHTDASRRRSDPRRRAPADVQQRSTHPRREIGQVQRE